MSKATSPQKRERITAEYACKHHREGLEKLAERDDLAGLAAEVLLETGGVRDDD